MEASKRSSAHMLLLLAVAFRLSSWRPMLFWLARSRMLHTNTVTVNRTGKPDCPHVPSLPRRSPPLVKPNRAWRHYWSHMATVVTV